MAIETKHKKPFEKEALEMDARNKETYETYEKKTLEEEVEGLVEVEELVRREEARQKAQKKQKKLLDKHQ